MPSAQNPLSFTPLEVNTMNITFGSSYNIPYGELGYMVSAMMPGLHEPQFRPRFMRMCSSGLVTFESWKEMEKDIRNRKVIHTAKTIAAIRDLGIFHGGDKYYYSTFMPEENYKDDPSKLDRFSDHKYGFGPKKKPTRKDILDLARRNNQVAKSTKQHFYFG